jgi:hypothetical protein
LSAGKYAEPSSLERQFDLQIHAFRLPTPEREYCFHPTRKWRVDRAWPEFRIAVEIEGLVPPWLPAGRHQRARGYELDVEKHNALTAAGWTLYRYTRRQIMNCEAIREIADALARAAHLPGGRG